MIRKMGGALAALLLVTALLGCSESQQLSDASDEADASAVVTAEPTVEPTTAPTPTRKPTPAPTPKPESALQITREVVFAWGDGDPFYSYQVIAELTNTGDGWAEVDPFDSDYQITSDEGALVSTGSFTYASPAFIGPGEVGYLIETFGIADGVAIEDFDVATVNARYDDVAEPEVTFTFDRLTLKMPEGFMADYDGPTATGFITSSVDVDDAAIFVVCLDAEGAPIGATSTNLVQNLTAGEPKGFETIMGMPLGTHGCVELRAFGDDTGF